MNPQTHARLMQEAQRDKSLHIWLGFSSRIQMEAALRDNPTSIKQIPAALLSLLEDGEGRTTLPILVFLAMRHTNS